MDYNLTKKNRIFTDESEGEEELSARELLTQFRGEDDGGDDYYYD